MEKIARLHPRGKLSTLVEEAQSKGKVFAITRHGKPAAVLIGYDELESIRKANKVLSDKEFMDGMRQSIKSLHKDKNRVYALEDLSR